MKQKMITYFNRVVLVLMMALTSTLTYAQDGGADINVNVTKDGGAGGWYANPWIWIVGAAVFILLLVAIVRGGSRTSD